MADEILCPCCGSRGEATTDDTGAFEVRGRYQDKAIRKCRKCGAGLAIGLSSGGLFGKPSVIVKDTWERMEAEWEREFSSHNSEEGTPKPKTMQQGLDDLYAAAARANRGVQDRLNGVSAVLAELRADVPTLDGQRKINTAVLGLMDAMVELQKLYDAIERLRSLDQPSRD